MRIAAGIDIGNSTTEAVLAQMLPGQPPRVIGVGRAPTRGSKGSPRSLDGAAALVARLERTHQTRIEIAAVARLRPVETGTASLPEPRVDTGRLRLVNAGSHTVGGAGFGAGRPWLVGTAPPDGPVVAIVPSGIGFRKAVEELRHVQPVAVVLADDEGVLVANRMRVSVPVVDEVDVAPLLEADLVLVEVAAPGRVLATFGDPLRLAAAAGLSSAEREHAARITTLVTDASNAVVALTRDPVRHAPEDEGWVELAGGRRETFTHAHPLIVAGLVGLATGYCLPGTTDRHAVDDLWTTDLSAIADTVLARRATAGSRSIGLAALTTQAPLSDPAAALAERLGVPVQSGSESRAGWLGACSTPGIVASDLPGTVTLDLGGGTIDASTAAGDIVAAGSGELLTRSVALLLASTPAVAEWVKRGAAERIESPQLSLTEEGERRFLDQPAPAAAIGSLAVRGPAGLLPFAPGLAPGEWRSLRLRLKVDVLGANVARALRTLEDRGLLTVTPHTVLVVGGPAGDDEVLSAVSRALPDGVAAGRGAVGGDERLGHRYAVAYGLLGLLSG